MGVLLDDTLQDPGHPGHLLSHAMLARAVNLLYGVVYVAPSVGSTYRPNLAQGGVHVVELAGGITVGRVQSSADTSGASQFLPGSRLVFVFVQPASGGSTVVWDASYAGAPTVDPAAASVMTVEFVNLSAQDAPPIWRCVQAGFLSVGAAAVGRTAKAVATSNVASLSGLPTIDGVSFGDGEIALLVAQTAASRNGLWRVHSGAWTRPSDYATADDAAGATVFVEAGSTQAATIWGVVGAGPYVIDTNVTTWIELPSQASVASASAAAQAAAIAAAAADATTKANNAATTAETYADRYAGSAAGTVGRPLAATDPTTADARTPLGHHATHSTGGSDAIAPVDIGAAPLASPGLTGNPTAPTQTAGNSSTRLATTAFATTADLLRLRPQGAWAATTPYVVNDAVTANGVAWRCISAHTSGSSFSADPTKWERFGVGQVTGTAPPSPDATTLWYDSATDLWKHWNGTVWVVAGAGTYAPLVSPALTGTPTAPTPTAGDNTTKLATTAFVAGAVSAVAQPLPGLAFFDVVGHSIPGGGGVTNGEWNSYPNKLAHMLGSPRRMRNMAIGGARSCWQSNKFASGDGGWGHVFSYGSQSIPPVGTDAGALTNEVGPGGAGRVPALPQADLAIVHIAGNDMGSLGIGNPTPMQEAHRTIIGRLIAAALARVNDSSLTFTGTWSTGNVGGIATEPDGYKITTTVNDKVTFAVPVISQDAGNRMIGFSVILNPAHDYTVGVTIDGVAQPDVRMQGSTLCDQAGSNGSTPMFNAITRRYSVDQTVTHSLVVTLKSVAVGGSQLIFDSCYIEADPADGPIVVVPGFHRCVDYSLWSGFPHAADYTDANILTWHNTYVAAVAAEFSHCLYVDYDSAINKDPALIYGDNAHLNDAGHGVLAKTLYDSLVSSGRVTSRRASRISPGMGEFWRQVGQNINNYPPFLNSWVNSTGVGGSTCAFRKDINGRVHIRGVVKSGSAANAVVFNLPSGYRPATNRFFATVISVAGTATVQQVEVGSSGDVWFANGGSTTVSSLDGISFDAEQ